MSHYYCPISLLVSLLANDFHDISAGTCPHSLTSQHLLAQVGAGLLLGVSLEGNMGQEDIGSAARRNNRHKIPPEKAEGRILAQINGPAHDDYLLSPTPPHPSPSPLPTPPKTFLSLAFNGSSYFRLDTLGCIRPADIQSWGICRSKHNPHLPS